MHEEVSVCVYLEQGIERVPVPVTFSDRKRLSISVYQDGSVAAEAPLDTTLAQVEAHILRRQTWIVKQRRYYEEHRLFPVQKHYLSGETHLYLGRQYRVRILHDADHSVKLVGGYFIVHVPAPQEPQVIAAALGEWYQAHAEKIFMSRLDFLSTTIAPVRDIGEVKLRITNMKRRWGSCSQAGMITLNTNLVKAPVHCIDYVIMHELCHLRYHDHSPAFFRMLGRCLPDWSSRKERLDSFWSIMAEIIEV